MMNKYAFETVFFTCF